MIKLKSLLPLIILLTGCKGEDRSVFTALNDHETASPTTGVKDYESQWFQYPDYDSVNHCLTKLKDVCVVKYYVNGDTIFSSEKYHFVSLGYSYDSDTTLAYMHTISFDRSQEADADGWYKIVIDKDKIPREPGTHISSVGLRSYCGDKYPNYKHMPHANAILFNATKEMGFGRDRNVISPQLSKLYDIIK